MTPFRTYIILVGTAIMDDIFDDEAIRVCWRVPLDHHFSCTVGNQLGFYSGGVDVVCFLCTRKNVRMSGSCSVAE